MSAAPANPRLVELADACVQCGLCLPHCPTYRLDRREGESPRGRIVLIKGLAQGRLDADAADVHRDLNDCLGCRACEAVCPARVEYGRLLMAGRGQLREARPAAARQRWIEVLAMRPRLISALFGLIRPWRRWLPRRWVRTLPQIPPAFPARDRVSARRPSRGRLGLFLGCFARRLDAPAHQAACEVLTRLGWDVVVPQAQACCGSLHAHAGAVATAAALARELGDVFANAGVETVLVSSSGCHEAVAAALQPRGIRVRELCRFVLDDAEFAAVDLRPLPQRIALHTPCTQRNVLRDADAAARLLAAIPNLTIDQLRTPGCCGAAGSHMLLQPRRAAALRAPLLAEIDRAAADRVCTSNIGCRLHLQAEQPAAAASKFQHPIELIAAQWP